MSILSKIYFLSGVLLFCNTLFSWCTSHRTNYFFENTGLKSWQKIFGKHFCVPQFSTHMEILHEEF